MRICKKWSTKGEGFDLLTCTEISMENLHVNIGHYRVNSPGMVKTKIVWKNLWLLTVNDSPNIDL